MSSWADLPNKMDSKWMTVENYNMILFQVKDV